MNRFRNVAVAVGTVVMMGLVSMPLFTQQEQQPPTGIEEQTRSFFSGGALKGVRKISENSPTTTASHDFVSVPGASVSWFVPANDSDLLNVSFTAECRLINNALPPAGASNWVGMRVVLVRAPAGAGFPTFMQPYDTTSPMAFCAANDYAMHRADFAARVSGGATGATYTAVVQYKVTGAAGLSAWLDDYVLELFAFN